MSLAKKSIPRLAREKILQSLRDLEPQLLASTHSEPITQADQEALRTELRKRMKILREHVADEYNSDEETLGSEDSDSESEDEEEDEDNDFVDENEEEEEEEDEEKHSSQDMDEVSENADQDDVSL